MDWDSTEGVLFDLDGVLTPTAVVHMRAWELLFTRYFAEREIEPRYTDADYFEHIDGRSRYDGVRATLLARGVPLPEGDPADPPGTASVCGLGNAKDALVRQIFADDGMSPYPGSVRVLDDLERRGIPMGVVSSSRNAVAVLTMAGLRDRFDVVVDGLVAEAEGLPGKPHPRMFLVAASRLGVRPRESAVVEDAVSGVAAARAGDFGLVVGVDRGAGAAALTAAGAHLVVGDLDELLPRA